MTSRPNIYSSSIAALAATVFGSTASMVRDAFILRPEIYPRSSVRSRLRGPHVMPKGAALVKDRMAKTKGRTGAKARMEARKASHR